MNFISRLFRTLIGPPKNPLHPDTRKSMVLVAFIAWIGLGADGLSSACYGPEQAFVALKNYTYLAPYISLATGFTVFLIAAAYNQVIELFPSGGGGYKIATHLIGPYTGLVSGASLMMDYILTIAVSTASGVDSLFSLFPNLVIVNHKVLIEVLIIILLINLNLRGVKESIKVLMPIFVGFMAMHLFVIGYGIYTHHDSISIIAKTTTTKFYHLKDAIGLIPVICLLLKVYSLGGGTYTGLETVSNNVNILAEPRVKTGKWTMFYMALSLSFISAGIILIYLLSGADSVSGQTMNAIAFAKILGHSAYGNAALTITLLFEACLLFAGANTGLLAGTALLSNMAIDQWVPNKFRYLSSRLVTQNGVLLFGIGAILILIWSQGSIALLVVMYSISVFVTFSLSIFGLCIYWVKHKSAKSIKWIWRFSFSSFAFLITAFILFTTVITKFAAGGWFTILIICALIAFCIFINRHYKSVSRKVDMLDCNVPKLEIKKHKTAIISKTDADFDTAVIFVYKHIGICMKLLDEIKKMFPNYFKNFVFLTAGTVDVESFKGDEALSKMQFEVESNLRYFTDYCAENNLNAEGRAVYGTDTITELTNLSHEVAKDFKNAIFFAPRLLFDNYNWFTRILHNETATTLQQKLNKFNIALIIIPVII